MAKPDNNTNGTQNEEVKKGFLNSSGFGAIVNTLSNGLNAFPTPNADLNDNTQLATGIRQGISDGLVQSNNPYMQMAGVGLKALSATGGFTDASKGLGGTNDTLNTITSIALPGAGWLAGKTLKYKVGTDTQAMKSSYEGTYDDNKTAAGNAGAKLLFGGSKANSMIRSAMARDAMISNIKNESDEDYLTAATMTQGNAIQNQFALRGGFSQALARAGKLGMKINKARNISRFIKQPEFKDGGSFDFRLPEDIFVPKTDEQNQEFFSNLKFDDVPEFQKGGTIANPTYEQWIKDINPDYINENYDLETAYKYLDKEQLNKWKWAVNSFNPKFWMDYYETDENGEKIYPYHLSSVASIDDGDYIFLKKGTEETNPELHWEIDSYHNGKNGLNKTHDLVYEGDRYYYRKKKNVESHKEGGQMNLIPEGNLHARLHHMEDADKLTKKGIPVVDMDGNQQAEIECNELVMNLELTTKIEELYKKFYKEDISEKEKDELAIKAGKLLAKEIIENTDDRTGLIDQVQ